MVGIRLPDTADPGAVDFATRMAGLGFETIWTGELWGADAFVQLTAIGERVDADLGTAIVNVYSRSPAVLAGAVATLDGRTDGTVKLGVGVSTPKAIEDLHGLAFDRPIRRTHEAVELIKRFTAGDGRVDYAGEVFDVADFPALDADVPIFNAALGPANRRVTGRLCDGWIPHNIPFTYLGEAFETIEETAREVGRDPDDITVSPYVPTAASEDPTEARAAIRGHVAYYAGSGEGYRKAVATDFPDEAQTIADAWQSGDRDAAREAVTDEMVDALGVAGTPATAREQFYELMATDPVDDPILVPPASLDTDAVERTAEAIAPDG